MTKKQTFTHNKTQLGGGMKPLFTLLISIAIILAISFLATAASCGNSGGGGGNNSNSGGGDNGGGNTPDPDTTTPYDGPLEITVKDAVKDSVKLVDGDKTLPTIKIKPSAFPTTVVGDATKNFKRADLDGKVGDSIIRIFDISYKDATGGLTLVKSGKLNSASELTSLPGHKALPTDDTANDGLFFKEISLTSQSFRVFSVFMKKGDPASLDPNEEPFAFSATTGTDATKPVFYCFQDVRVAQPAGSAYHENSTFNRGQLVACFVFSIGATAFGNTAAYTKWLGDSTIKKSFNIAVVGIKTDAKKITEMGIPGADWQAVAAKLTAGLSGADMTAFLAANPHAYRRVKLSIVSDF